MQILGRADNGETQPSAEVPSPSADLSAPLQRPAFRRLAITFTLNELADWMAIIALAILVFDRTDSAMATTALFLGTRFAPALLGPALVVRAERTPPRLALPVLYCAEAVAFAVLALLVDHFSLTLVIVVGVIDGTIALAGRSLTRAVVAALLKPVGELRSGNAILNMGFTAGTAAGPALAGLLVAGVGVQSALLVGAGAFLSMAAVMFAGPLPHAEPEQGRWKDRLRAGLAYVAARAPLRRLLAAESAAFIFFCAVIPIEVVYAIDTLEAGDSGYGALLASWGIGMVLGGLVFARLRQTGFPALLLFSTIAVGAAYIGLAAAPTLLVACAISVPGGIGNGVQWVALVSAMQEITRDTMQARVMSVLESVVAIATGVGFLVGGLIAAGHNPRTTFLVAGLGVLFVTAIAARSLARTPWAKGEITIGQAEFDADSAQADDSGNVGEGQRQTVSGAQVAGREGN